MKHYSLLEHTSDIRLKLEASTLQELFTVALEGMNVQLKHKALHDTPTVTEEVFFKSMDVTALLIDFLSEILTLSNIKKCIFTQVTFHLLTQNEIKATVRGVPVDSFNDDIKAVTYHEAFVQQNERGNFESLVVFDI